MADLVHNQYLTFRMEDELYAASVAEVESVLGYTEITQIPGTEAALLGVINLRGKALPIIDLRKKVGLEQKPITKDTSIIVLSLQQEGETITSGVLVESVDQVIFIEEDKVQPPPPIGLKIDSDFIRGIANLDNQFVILLNIRSVFNQRELEAMSQVNKMEGEESSEE